MKSKLEIYALSVCFASVICLVLSLGIGSYALISINSPSLTMKSYLYERFQTNESFWVTYPRSRPCQDRDCNEIDKPTENEITKKREVAFVVAKKNESREGLQALIRSALFLLFSSITLLIHWKIASKSRIVNGV